METKYHFYNFCFVGYGFDGLKYDSVKNNFDNKNITIGKIEETKKKAEIHKDAVLMSCSYLGYMTYKEFTEG